MPYKILLVDNDPNDLEVSNMALSAIPEFEVIAELDAERAIDLVKAKPRDFAVVILDYRMNKNGLVTAKEMLAINPHLSIALFSADQRRELLKECISGGDGFKVPCLVLDSGLIGATIAGLNEGRFRLNVEWPRQSIKLLNRCRS